jgi:PAS domain S-box-containing protein
MTDTEGHFVLANPAYVRFIGYSEQELQAINCQSLTHPDDLPENLRVAERLLSGEEKTSIYEKRFIRKDGEIRWARNRYSVVRDGRGAPTNFVILLEDITEVRMTSAAPAPLPGVRDLGRFVKELQDQTDELLSVISASMTVLPDSAAREAMKTTLAMAERSIRGLRETAGVLLNYLEKPKAAGQTVAATGKGSVRAQISSGSRLGLLTPRELEVLKLVGEGKRSKEIAHQLRISVKTVNVHRTNIMEKLDIHEAPSLIKFAIREGISQA